MKILCCSDLLPLETDFYIILLLDLPLLLQLKKLWIFPCIDRLMFWNLIISTTVNSTIWIDWFPYIFLYSFHFESTFIIQHCELSGLRLRASSSSSSSSSSCLQSSLLSVLWMSLMLENSFLTTKALYEWLLLLPQDPGRTQNNKPF